MSSADISKLAMIRVFHDKELNSLGFKLNLMIHDELMGECPKENAFRCSERLMEVMCQAASDLLEGFPMRGDCEICKCWYGSSITRENQVEIDNEVVEP